MHGKNGIKRRFVIKNLIYMMLVIGICIAVFSVSAMNYYYMSIKQSLESSAEVSAEFFGRGLSSDAESFYNLAKKNFGGNSAIRDVESQILFSNGRVVISSRGLAAGTKPATPEIDEAMAQKKLASFVGKNPLTGERIMSVSAPLISGDDMVVGVVRYVTSLKNVDKRIVIQTAIALLIGAVMALYVFLSNRFFVKSILSPLQEITDITKQITKGSYGVKIDKKFDDEIGELADSINEMSAEIARVEKIKNEFISSVSHELRTPLTAIIGWGETLTAVGMENKEEASRGVEIILKETRRLSKMVEELLDFARMESGRFTLYIDTVNLKAEFEETLFMYSDTFRKAGIEMKYEQDELDDIIINGDRERLKQVFFNILDNAVKHGKSGGKIDIRVFRDGKTAKIEIRDYGEGISPEELPYVKMKFYKGTSKAQGSGIGLAVSDEIVNLHGGELEISSTVGDGTCVIISLPIKETEQEE